MRLLAACLLAASGGLARQRLLGGSAPLSPLSASSEPLHHVGGVFPLSSLKSPFSPAGSSRVSLPLGYRRVSPAPTQFVAFTLSSSRHIPTFSFTLEYPSLSLARARYPSPRTYLPASSPFSTIRGPSLSISLLYGSIVSLASTRYLPLFPPLSSCYHAFPLSLRPRDPAVSLSC